jgi:hypothetical protein
MNQFLDTKYFGVYSEIIYITGPCLQRLKMFLISSFLSYDTNISSLHFVK